MLINFNKLFLGESPNWFKRTMLLFLLLNPLILWVLGPVVTGWALLLEFVFCLSMALHCYPLQSGGLLALQALLLNLTTAEHVYAETLLNIEVLLLLVFMVAGIFFMREFLLITFTRILLGVKNRTYLSLLILTMSALLSAFLDALTVTAVLISVCVGFYSVFYQAASGVPFHHDQRDHHPVRIEYLQDLAQFRLMLCSLVMHGLVGTALGGVCTMVGEPQNLLIAERLGWNFVEFFLQMSHVTIPVFIVGLISCLILEKFKIFGYGQELPETVRQILLASDLERRRNQEPEMRLRMWIQGLGLLLLVLALGFHIATVGLIGLALIVFLTVFTGVVKEHQLGRAFEEALPFTALLVVFFAIVAVINDQQLFYPVLNWVLNVTPEFQAPLFYLANGALSAVSDNVFVATTYISELTNAHARGEIDSQSVNRLAIAINTGTNIPSIITPNGQAAFLFMLTSPLAPLIRLSYLKMVWMALPYTVLLTLTGLVMNYF